MRSAKNSIELVILLLFACNSRAPQNLKTNSSDSISKNKLDQIIDTANKGYPYEIIPTYLNNDTATDYFVIDHSGMTTGQFFDGKSRNEISTDGVNIPWSRPGVELEYRIINLLCQDLQKEVLVKGGSGGTGGLNLTTEIYRFDSTTGQMKLVFQHDELISHHDGRGNDVVDETNYIGLTYDKDSCDIKVFVCKGTYRNDTMVALKNAKKTFYHFDILKQQFEESK